MLHPGVIGGFVIPLLGALPDALIILVSGIGDNPKEEIVSHTTTTYQEHHQHNMKERNTTM